MSQKINPIAFRLGVKQTWLELRDPISNSLEKQINIEYVNYIVRKLIIGIMKKNNYIPSEIHLSYKTKRVIKITLTCWNATTIKETTPKKTLNTIINLLHLILSLRFPLFNFYFHVVEVQDYTTNAEILSTHLANTIGKSPMQFKFILKNLALKKIQNSNL